MALESIFDKVVEAVTPEASAERKAEARAKAQSLARPGDWLSLVLAHHLQIEAAFARVKSASDAAGRVLAQKALGIVLTGHAIAEESVIYPSLADAGEKGHAKHAYTEQATAKMGMAELEKLDPMSQAYLDKLEHIRSAVAHHVYEEEGTWFPELRKKASAADQAKISQRYEEEFQRYVGGDSRRANAA
jgi:hemerythrin superfamily protein